VDVPRSHDRLWIKFGRMSDSYVLIPPPPPSSQRIGATNRCKSAPAPLIIRGGVPRSRKACAVRVTEVKRGGPRGACAGQRAVGPVPGGPLARRIFLGRIICTPWPVFVSALGKVTALRRWCRPGSGDFLRRTSRTRKSGRLNQRHCTVRAQKSHDHESSRHASGIFRAERVRSLKSTAFLPFPAARVRAGRTLPASIWPMLSVRSTRG
jgi:hypothetical protein